MKPGPDSYRVSSAYDLTHTCLSASAFPSTCLQQFTGHMSTLYGSASLVRPLSSSNLGEQGSPISNVINTLRIYMYVFAYDLHTRSTRSHDCVCTCRCGCTCVHVWRALRSVLMSSSAGLHLSFETGSLTKPRGVDCPANGLQRFACP